MDHRNGVLRRDRQQQWPALAAAGDLDVVDPGDALGLEGCVGIGAHRHAGGQSHARDHPVRVVRIQRQLGDLADLDAVEVDLPAVRKAGHGSDENDVVDVELLGELEARQPDHEGHQADEQPKCDGAHQGVVGVTLHQPPSRPSRCAPDLPSAAARPRGPRKYSRIQGWSACSISLGVPVATTRLSAITATRSQIV